MSLLSKFAGIFRQQVRLASIELARSPAIKNQPLNYERVAFEIAAHESARYLIDHLQGTMDHVINRALLKESLSACTIEGLILEFGVYSGGTIRAIAGTTSQEVHGFDSFEGLPENWTHFQKAGRFSLDGNLPDMTGFPNVSLHKGWFEKTLLGFLASHPGPVRFLHVDSDLYSSAKTVLTLLADRIVPGTVIVFDEYLNYPGWQKHEYKAWQEAGRNYRYLGFASSDCGVSVVVD